MQVITANRLIDGLVVFLDASGGWTVTLQDARRLETPEAGAAALAQAQASVARQEAVDAYAVDVTVVDGALRPKEIKERIRAGGPTVASAFPDQMRPRPQSPASSAA